MGQTSHLVEIQTMICEIENSSQGSKENICKTTVLNHLQKNRSNKLRENGWVFHLIEYMTLNILLEINIPLGNSNKYIINPPI